MLATVTVTSLLAAGCVKSALVVVNAPDTLVTNYAIAGRFARMQRGTMPKAVRLLGIALAGTLEVSRPEARTLSITLSEGLLHDWTSRVFRTPDTPFRVGDRVEVPGMVAVGLGLGLTLSPTNTDALGRAGCGLPRRR